MYTEPTKGFFAQLWTQQHYGFEFIPTYNYASYGAWEFGGEVKFPSGQYEQAPSIVRYPILSEEDVKRIESNGLPDVSIRSCVPY
jgi:uroporphyrinogen decarboxylase